MNDRLPASTVRIDIPYLDFFNRLAIVAEEYGKVRAIQKHRPGPLHCVDILELHTASHPVHEGLFVQLIHTMDSGNNVRVEVRARRWGSDNNLTFEIYVEALNYVFRKLLATFNKKYGSRYRLVIQSKIACEPSLSPKAREAFDVFVNGASKSDPHPSDWKYFYYFCRICHVYRAHSNEEDVFRLLLLAGFTEELARNLATVFGHLRAFQNSNT